MEETKRVYKLKVYFQDSPSPWYVDNVWHIQTEGGLLRLIIDGKSQWFPLCNIQRLEELDKREFPVRTGSNTLTS